MGAKVILFNGLINAKMFQKFLGLQFITFNLFSGISRLSLLTIINILIILPAIAKSK